MSAKTGRRRSSIAGFTLVEAVIVLAIIILIAALLLVSFPSFSDRINLQRSSQKVALSFRKAQNMALAVRQFETSGGAKVIPAAYGLYLNRTTMPGEYLFFADLDGNGLYSAVADGVVETVKLEPTLAFSNFTSDAGGQSQTALTIVFSVPEATAYIRNADATPTWQSAEIFLAGRVAGYTRSVIVRTSGQIQINRQ